MFGINKYNPSIRTPVKMKCEKAKPCTGHYLESNRSKNKHIFPNSKIGRVEDYILI